jgi:hypothetical protein
MIFPSVNLLGVLLGGIANMIVGFIWYSPQVMGKPWMRLMGFTEKSIKDAQKKMGPLYGLSFVGALIQAAVISVILKMTFVDGLGNALLVGGLLWLGFIAVTQLTDAIFNIRKFNPHLLAINTFYQLLSILIMTTVLYLV